MKKNLVIVESPSKAKTIAKYLGAGYTVEASGGHIRDLPEHGLGVDIENNFHPRYEISPKKKETVSRLKKAVSYADGVFLATDPDREGEAISWHLAAALELTGSVKRIVFNEISKKAVTTALNNSRDIDIGLVNAQQARRVLDRLVGYKLSPIISKKIRNNLSAGRVQSAALRMIVDREKGIRAFVPKEYWNLFAVLKKADGEKIKAAFEDINGKKHDIPDKMSLDRILAAVVGGGYRVDSVKKGQSKSHPAPPFTTSTMQQDANRKLGMSSPMSMQLAQQLYEGVELNGTPTALVTYIRTDSVRVSPDSQAEAAEYIKEKYGEDYVPKKPNVYQSKKGAQDAHEAIRPIAIQVTPESLSGKVNKNQLRLYKLIYDRFLASQMTDAIYNTVSIRIAVKGNDGSEYGYRLKGKTVAFAGYTAIYSDAQEEGEENKLLPNLNEGEPLEFIENLFEQKFTKPLPRYTDATLVKAMEENGIGRPSTYATVISVLLKREYCDKAEKALAPTELGERVVSYLVDHFEDIIDIEFTANMESKLDDIEESGKEWQKVIAEFYPAFKEKLDAAQYSGDSYKTPPVETDTVCEKCGAKMIVKESRFGKFLGCPNYPACKNTKSMEPPAAQCPKCGADVIKRKSKTGKVFYGCSGYPKCDFISWDLPAPFLCPKCACAMRVYTPKEGNTKYICTNGKCRYQESAPK